MKSKNDPILDAQAICTERPTSPADLRKEMVAFGWHEALVDDAIKMATGTYIQLNEAGLFVPRAGNVREAVLKATNGDEKLADGVLKVLG